MFFSGAEAIIEQAKSIDFATLTTSELRVLMNAIDRVLEVYEDDIGRTMEEAELADGMAALKASHYDRINSIAKKLEKGKITLDQFTKEAHRAIGKNFRTAYEMNVGAGAMDAGADEYLRRATSAEMRYAKQFGNDIVGGTTRMPISRRAGMYARTLDGIGWNAKVSALPANARIIWKLGVAEHCEDCILLAANSPYTKWNLPTTPKAGATKCLSNCQCKLVFSKGRLTKEELKDAAAYAYRKGQTLAAAVARPPLPAGLRYADEVEQAYIDDLRARMNYQRRLVAAGDADAIAARKSLNAELIEFTEKQAIYDVPVYSVGEVLDETVIGSGVVDDLFKYSINGGTIELMTKKQANAMLARHRKLAGEAFGAEAMMDASGVKYQKPSVQAWRGRYDRPKVK